MSASEGRPTAVPWALPERHLRRRRRQPRRRRRTRQRGYGSTLRLAPRATAHQRSKPGPSLCSPCARGGRLLAPAARARPCTRDARLRPPPARAAGRPPLGDGLEGVGVGGLGAEDSIVLRCAGRMPGERGVRRAWLRACRASGGWAGERASRQAARLRGRRSMRGARFGTRSLRFGRMRPHAHLVLHVHAPAVQDAHLLGGSGRARAG